MDETIEYRARQIVALLLWVLWREGEAKGGADEGGGEEMTDEERQRIKAQLIELGLWGANERGIQRPIFKTPEYFRNAWRRS
jgi:hypothetical protein